jgi:putative DNA primase/helicase
LVFKMKPRDANQIACEDGIDALRRALDETPDEMFEDEDEGPRNDGAPPIDADPSLLSSASAKAIAVAARAELITLENLKMDPTDWLWDGWIARGEIALIAGAPECGKTTIALALAAILSSGGKWPDMTDAAAGNILIWTGEDNPEKTIKPRLIQMGADPKKIWVVKGKRDENGKLIPFNPATDLPILAAAAKDIKGGVDMLIIDPIVSVVGGKVDNGNNAGHREKLQPLVDFAKGMNCAVIGMTHFTKGTAGKDPVERVTESLAFGAIARVIFAATKNKNEDPERIFVMAKNNLGPLMGAFGYSIVGAPLAVDPRIIATRVLWGEPIEGDPREILTEAEGDGKGEDRNRTPAQLSAQAWLHAALSCGARKQTEIAAEGAEQGFSSDKIFRASKALRVVKRKETFTGAWLWSLPL